MADEFGTAVSCVLAEKGMTQMEFARYAGLSQPYVSYILRGLRPPHSKWVDIAADVLNLSRQERKRLHAKAARDNGFDIELPPL